MIVRHARAPRPAICKAAAFALVLGALSGGGADASPGAAASPAGSAVLRDDLHREVTLPRHPRRIITLLPSLTETLCALDACDRLVATDRYSNWPVQVRSLPKVGGLEDANIELIVSLMPDVVVLSRSQRITERLRELGVVSFAVNTESYADIGHTVRIMGEILGLPDRAINLNERIERAVQEVGQRAWAQRRGEGPTVYFEVERGPYAAGPSSFIGELLSRLGARNILPADLGAFPKLNPEYVVRRNPEVIFTEATGLAERPGWERIRAVREHRLCSLTPEVRDIIVRPGPRVAEGMRAIADCLARVAP
jgi:cobalamin transport system substrate-binding protein